MEIAYIEHLDGSYCSQIAVNLFTDFQQLCLIPEKRVPDLESTVRIQEDLGYFFHSVSWGFLQPDQFLSGKLN